MPCFAEEEQGNVYSRYANPNTDEFVRKMALLEGAADGIAFASGMAAVFGSLAAFLRSGDHVVASRALFGSTHQLFTKLLPRWGITATYVDADASPEAWAAACTPQTMMLFVETPSNPGLALIDLDMLGQLCAQRGLLFVVDNCFTTPILQQPISHGAHLVVHSATKYIDGQGRVLGGVVVGTAELIAELRFFIRHTGPAMSAFNAWVLSKSLETLSLRMERHCANALAVATHFEGHASVAAVRYPFPEEPPRSRTRTEGRCRPVAGSWCWSCRVAWSGPAAFSMPSRCSRTRPTSVMHAASSPIRRPPRTRS